MNCPDLAINKFNDHVAVRVNELPPTLPKSFFKEHKFSFADSYDVRCRYTSRIGWFILTTEVKEVLVNFLKGKRVLEVGSGTEFKPRKIRFVNQLGETRVGLFYSEWNFSGLILTPVPGTTAKLIFPKKKKVVRFVNTFEREPEYDAPKFFNRNLLNKWVYVFKPHKTI